MQWNELTDELEHAANEFKRLATVLTLAGESEIDQHEISETIQSLLKSVERQL